MTSTDHDPLRIQVIVASTRPDRLGLPIGEWVRDRLLEKGYQVDFADLAVVDLPFFDEPKHPRFRQYQHQHTKDWSARVDVADAFIFVTPEYNHSFTAPLKNAIDFVSQEWARKPVGFVSYGGISGGTRAVQSLKPSLLALKMTPIVEAVTIPFVSNLFEDGVFKPTESLEKSLDGMVSELVLVSETLEPLRAKQFAPAR